MNKKLFALLMVVAMLCMAFAGCGNKEAGEAADGATDANGSLTMEANTVEETIIEGEDDSYDPAAIIESLKDDLADSYKVCFLVKTLVNPFFVAMENGVKEYVRDCDTWTTVQCDNDASQMLTKAEDVANADYDIILMTPINSSDIAPIKAAYDNGSMVVLLDTTVVEEGLQYVAGTVCTDNYSAGRMDGEAFVKILEEKYGEVKGTCVLYENPQGLVTLARIQGFEDVIAEYDGIEILYREVGKGQVDTGLAFMENVLQRYDVGKGELDGVMSMNDPSAQGCANALQQAGYTAEDCAIFGVDGSDESLAYIEKGIQMGTALQYPGTMAARGLAIAYQKLAGVELTDEECFLEISTTYIDKTNYQDYAGYAYIGD